MSKIPKTVATLAAVVGGTDVRRHHRRRQGTFYDVFTHDNRHLMTIVKRIPHNDWLVCLANDPEDGRVYSRLTDINVSDYLPIQIQKKQS